MGGGESLLRFQTEAGPDEVWEQLPLDDLGIPSPAAGPNSYGCGLAASADSVWVAANNPPAAVRVGLDPATDDMQVERAVPLPRGPSAIAVGAGSVWAADRAQNVVRQIHPGTGAVLAVIPVGRGPVAVAVGAGYVWVAAESDDSVSRFDPVDKVVRKVAVGESPVALTVGEGSVWVANSRDGTVSRIDPSTNQVAETISVGHRPQGIAVAAGFVWVTVRR